MIKEFFKAALPHFIAIVIFIVVATIYCSPVLQGEVLNQSDIVQWKGMAQECFDYKSTHGHFPLWTNSMFCGMPAFQIVIESTNRVTPGIFYHVLTLGLPVPINFFVLASICFYFLSQVLRVNTFIGIIGALAFAFTTYNIGIIEAGHETKMRSIAILPAFIASILLIYEKKYLWGVVLTAIFTTLFVSMNHYQIVYYSLILVVFMTLSYLISWLKSRQYAHAATAIGLSIFGGILGVACNATVMLTTLDTAKKSIRGGSELPSQSSSTSGLSAEYAMSYSMYKMEPFAVMVPGLFGSSGESILENKEESKSLEELQSMPPGLANSLANITQSYWGGIGPIPPNAPPYLGAAIVFLALVGFALLDNKHKWWMLAAILTSVLMCWGEYLHGFNTFLLENLPGYNKFRVPSMIIILPIFLLSVLAVLAAENIRENFDRKDTIVAFKRGLIIAGAAMVILFLFYLSADFVSQSDEEIRNTLNKYDPSVQNYINRLLSALKEDRQSLLFSSLLRTVLFMSLTAGLAWFYLKNKLRAWIFILLLGVTVMLDLLPVSAKYLNSDDFQEENTLSENFLRPSPVDQQLLSDSTFYRVLDRRQRNGAGGAMTSFFHNSVEGYHPAKLAIYQDLIEHQFSKFPTTLHILNMLNTKYFLHSTSTGEDAATLNPENLGAAWFVDRVIFKDSPAEVMNSLTELNVSDTAVVFSSDKTLISNIQPDSTSTVHLIQNYNDSISYSFTSATGGFIVFSEIFYDLGWKAFLNEKELPIIRTNYVLRGLQVPPGKQQKIVFIFKPTSYYNGETISKVAGFLVFLLGMIAFIIAYRNWRYTHPG